MPELSLSKPCTTSGGQEDERRPGPPERPVAEVNVNSPSRTRNASACSWWTCGRRSALAGPVDELGDGELVGVDEERRATRLRPVGRSSLRPSPPIAADDDEPGIAGRVLGRAAAGRRRRLPRSSSSRRRKARTKSPNPQLGTWKSRKCAGASPVTENVCTTSGRDVHPGVRPRANARDPRAGASARPRARRSTPHAARGSGAAGRCPTRLRSAPRRARPARRPRAG